MTIKRNIEAEIKITPEEMACEFWSMGCEEQAEFFNVLYKISGHMLPFQLQYVTDSDALGAGGRLVMSTIGEYSEAKND